jgi:hypothetical protein
MTQNGVSSEAKTWRLATAEQYMLLAGWVAVIIRDLPPPPRWGGGGGGKDKFEIADGRLDLALARRDQCHLS